MMILADLVWPSLVLGGRLYAWWIIAAGLLVEWVFVLRLTRATLFRSAIMTVVMNAISAGVGIFGIPLSGLLWELVASVTILPLFHWGTFNLVTWLISCVLAALLSTVVETASLRWIFKVPWTWRLFWWLALANAITVGMAMVSIMVSPPRM
jgi:hypothetical protein